MNPEAKKILKNSRTIAVVGLSSSPEKASFRVASYLKSAGYKVIPVNPNEQQIMADRCYACLADIPEKVDVVDIFRRPEDVPPIVRDAIRIGAKAVWMQLGIVNEDAATEARNAGLSVVMDECMMVKHRQFALQDD